MHRWKTSGAVMWSVLCLGSVALVPCKAQGQTLRIVAGPAFLFAPDEFVREHGAGHSVRAGVAISLSRHFDLLLAWTYARFPFTVEGYDRYEVRSYHPYESELVHYRVIGGDFGLQSIQAGILLRPLPAWSVRPYVSFGLGLGRNIYSERATDPPGSVFERRKTASGSLTGAASTGFSVPIGYGMRATLEGTVFSSSEIFFSRDFYTVRIGLDYQF